MNVVLLRCIMEDPPNFYVTGYSPDPSSMEPSPQPPSSFVFSGSSILPKAGHTSKCVGPQVPPRIERIVREVSGMKSSRTKIPEIGALHPPYVDVDSAHADTSTLNMHKVPAACHTAGNTTNLRPKIVPGVAGLHPPSRKQPGVGDHMLPPSPPSSTSKQQPVRNNTSKKLSVHPKRDPLLHKSVVTPPCPIQPDDCITPEENRKYIHVSIINRCYYYIFIVKLPLVYKAVQM